MFLSHPISTPQEIEPLLSHNRSDTTKPLYLVFYASVSLGASELYATHKKGN